MVETQWRISVGDRGRKYPDLSMHVASKPPRIVLLEIKVEAPLSLSLTSDGTYTSQLQIYRNWLDDPKEGRRGKLFILSKYFPEGSELCHGCIRWKDIHALAEQILESTGDLDTSHRFALSEFAKYLEEQGMAPRAISTAGLASIDQFRSFKEDLYSLLGQVSGRWMKQYELSRRLKTKKSESWWTGGGYVAAAGCQIGIVQVQPGLFVDITGVYPLFFVNLKTLIEPSKRYADRLRQKWETETWNGFLWVYGKCPDGFAQMTTSEQEDGLYKTGAATLASIINPQ